MHESKSHDLFKTQHSPCQTLATHTRWAPSG